MLQAIKTIEVKANNPSFNVKREWMYSLEGLEKYVGGEVEAFHVNDSITMWYAKMGNLKGLEPNIVIQGFFDDGGEPVRRVLAIRGDILITGTDSEGNPISLTDEEIGLVLECFIHRRIFQLPKSE